MNNMRGKDFFKQDKLRLGYYKRKMIDFLRTKEYSNQQIEIYADAYDYFCEFPDDYDGATVVKDLYDVGVLDLDAMLHDYNWLIYNVASSFKHQYLSNKLYSYEMARKGKRNDSILRFIGLTIIMPLTVLYSIARRGFMKKEKKREFLKIYKTLLNINGSVN